MSASRIAGIGHFLPPKVVTNFDVMKIMETTNEFIVERTGVPRQKVFVNVEEYGNIASASLPIAFHEARQAGMIRGGSRVLLVAFGSGFVWGSALLKM